MKYLGIDYGRKRVGIAVSDGSGTLAFPKIVLPRDAKLLDEIQKICAEEKIDEIVVGESLDYKGKPNVIMKDIFIFKTALMGKVERPVHFEPEFMTSAQAEHIQGKERGNDASAAAIILQSFLDKIKK